MGYKPLDVIYLCAGKGIRANLGYPKQYSYLNGKPLYIHALEKLISIKEISNIIIVSDNDDDIKADIGIYDLQKCFSVLGGETRQSSVFNGLNYVKSDFVLIAEAVRPFITIDFIKKIINTEGNVIPYMPLNSTPFNKKTGDVLSRDDTVCVQTPQKYVTEMLNTSHKCAVKMGLKDCTDDLALMKRVGICWNYTYIEGPIENIKITYPIDIVIAEAIYNYKNCIQE